MRFNNEMNQSTHENFSRDETVVAGSDRSFGLVMAVAFSVITLINCWHGGSLWPWMGGLAVLLVVVSLLRPTLLNPINRLWLKFGLILHKVTTPILMGLVFYGAVLPTGLIMRAAGKDLLRLKRQPRAESFWIIRQPSGPAAETMKDQF
jgi:hypothetical protein